MFKILLLPLFSLAAMLNPQGETYKVEGVEISPKAILEIKDKTHDLESVGAGLRFKKVVFVKAKVYVGQLLVSDSSGIIREKSKALDSLSSQKVVVMKMNFLRDVDSSTLEGAFKDSFKANGVSIEEETIKAFLKAVASGGEAKSGKAITIAGELLDGKAIISYEGVDGNVVSIEGPGESRKQIFSLWLGKATDGGVENLQEEILKK